jgi:hypothetical protein
MSEKKLAVEELKVKTFDSKSIQKVYKRHASHPGTVLRSNDNGRTWISVPVDSGKWRLNDWIFSFVELGYSKTLLWLDDMRDPTDSEWFKHRIIQDKCNVVWVKNYDEFTNWILDNGLPDAINFDHDLAEEHYTPMEYWDDYNKSKAYQEAQEYTEKTGYDCAKWLIDYCVDNNLDLPTWASHSFNPVGRDNINKLLVKFLMIKFS